MFKKILSWGTVAGLIVGSVLFGVSVAFAGHAPPPYGVALGYVSMLVALSAVFVGVKRHRDEDRGGIIRFWPAFGMGLGISFVASVFYVLAWEAALAATGVDFAADYARTFIEQQKAKGVSGEALARITAQMAQFQTQYANPLFRLPMTFVEIFPVGVLVSLVTAGLLRKPTFLPARRG